MADRARRERKSRLDKLAEYKRAREGGGRTWKEEDDVDLYDVVSEDQYKSIVRGRLAKDDFVVDDGIQGYMDNGVDDFEEAEEYVESDEDGRREKGKSRKTDAKPKPKGKPKAPPPSVMPSISAYRPTVSADQESDFMASLFADMDKPGAITPAAKSRKRKPAPEPDFVEGSSSYSNSRPSIYSYRNSYSEAEASSDGLIDDGVLNPPSSDDLILSPKKKIRVDNGDVTPAIEKMNKMDVHSTNTSSGTDDYDTSFDDMDMDAFMEIDDTELNGQASKPVPPDEVLTKVEVDSKVNGKRKQDEKPSWLSVYESLKTTSDDTLGQASGSRNSTSHADVSILEQDGSFRFFWIDYLEHEGRVYFVGKMQDKISKIWHSCCVTVENIQRNLFCLPRERRIEQDEETGELYQTDVIPDMVDVYKEFDEIRRAVGIKSWKGKEVDRSYAFGDKDIPSGRHKWFKVVYGFDEPQIHNSVCGRNIAKIMGTSSSAFELLVLKRQIMGPCWLQIKNPQLDHKGVSWCKVEVTVTDPKDINPILDKDPTAPRQNPPLTVMSLSLRTIVNHKENTREILCATARIWSNIDLDDPTPPDILPCTVRTFVRPLDRFPPNFEVRAGGNNKGVISPMKNERMLLNSLLATIHKADPDIVVGHEFLGVALDVLLHRMRDLKAEHWSRIGRFRRSKWPNIGRQGTNLKFINGRLLCDLASDSAKGMISSTTWSLTEMCKTHLNCERQEIDPDDTASYFDSSVSSPERLLTFVRHCELDAHYQMALAAKVQILPLTRQLTNLAGNSWNKTLNGGRAERNEYILLHEFHRKKYICPDKTWGKKAAAAEKELHDDDAEGGKPAKGKRDKYKGGLVFEPKRGLWDKYVLVMDFNSLYPSIIQEYNIDFTTVERGADEDGEDKIPEPPSSGVPQGVLPRLIAELVSRRREVKKLLKDRTASQAQLLQWDIKQMALKLTANSMYGCLGFEYSRFYARPLAALTTFKGREILTHTRELAESLQLDVVYGDTDSVFVNSNVTDLAQALKISADFKKAVNDRYKLLEIDLDGIFQRLLLLQKKKYAALKVEDGTRTSVEVKGLDMKRREYSVLSKNVSQYVLDQILSGDATETVVVNIHEYLTQVGEDIRAVKVKLDDFIIFKRLGKNPEDYPDAKSQPHVQVALRMKARGGTARSGDVIPYVFCLGVNGETAKSAQADKARHPDEVRRAGSELKIDYEYYLSQQILPPIERLCEPIEGTDRARLAECLGLDASRYRSSVADAEERTFGTLDSLTSDAERYKDAEPFVVRCRACQGHVAFEPIYDREDSLLQAAGPVCPACKTALHTASLQTQLEAQIRERIAKYYEGWTMCDDPTCRHRTRMMGVYGRRCLRPGCQGHVAFEYTDAQLYTQLRYYSWLFSKEGALKASSAAKLEEVRTLVEHQKDFLLTMSKTVDKYLDQSGRRWVNLTGLFSFMKM